MSEFADLSALVSPRSVVIVGASEKEASQGKRLLDNVVQHSRFKGDLYLVNPSYESMGSNRCWPSVAAIGEEKPGVQIDLALVIVNARHVLTTLGQCADMGIQCAVVMTSGFGETDAQGKSLEAEITALARRTGLRIYGPNCPGFVNVAEQLGFTFSPSYKNDLNPGSVGVATQGGGLGRNILQGLGYGDGVALWFSPGNEADLDVPDFIAHMATDENIRVISVLMEGVNDGRRLIDALKLAQAHGKPVVILKIGRSELGIKAAQSHTGSLAGSAAVNSAAFRQFGAIEVDDLDELVAVSRMLSSAVHERKAGLCIVTFSGGTAALAADIAGANGLSLASLSPVTHDKLSSLLPSFASIANPVDTTADILRDSDMLRRCLQAICNDSNVGTVLFPIPMDYGEITEQMGRTIAEVAATSQAQVVPVWMSRKLGGGYEVMDRAGLMPFFSITSAISAIRKCKTVSVSKGVKAGTAPVDNAADSHAPSTQARTEVAAKQLLRAHGINIPHGQLARSEAEAVTAAEEIGFPVVMKIVSAQIPHKTEAGGVRLSIENAQAARMAYASILESVHKYSPEALVDGVLVEKMLPRGGREMLIGVHQDNTFGPVLTVGLGGIYVEVLKDVAHRVLPITRDDASAMLRELKTFALLEGVRGEAGADLHALEDLLMKVSQFAQSQDGELRELDLNPVWVGAQGQGAIALDALIVQAALTKPSHQ